MSNARRRLLPRSDSRLCIYVPFWWIFNDSFWFVCELSFRPGLYNNAGLRVEPTEPICPHELLWSSKLPGPLSALGAHGVLLVAGELDYSGPLGIAVGHIYFFLEDIFPNQPGGIRILKTPSILRTIFDTPDEDPNYNPLPEERPGGFAWGEGQRLGG